MILAARGLPTLAQVVWITVAMVARADAGDGGEPADRPRARRPEPADGRAGAADAAG